MNRLISLISLGLLVSACGSSPTTDSSSINAVKLEPSKDQEFVKTPPLAYDSKSDVYVTQAPNDTNILQSESMARGTGQVVLDVIAGGDPIGRAAKLCYAGQVAQGIASLDEAYRQYWKHPNYWTQLGTCFVLQKDYRKALLYYNKALELDSKYAPALNNMGVIYLDQGKDQKALLAFETARKANPSVKTPVFNMGQLYLRYGYGNEALKLLMPLYKDRPNDIALIVGVATGLLIRGDAAKAINYFQTLPDDQLRRPDVGINVALAYYLVKNTTRAHAIMAALDKSKIGPVMDYYSAVARTIGYR